VGVRGGEQPVDDERVDEPVDIGRHVDRVDHRPEQADDVDGAGPAVALVRARRADAERLAAVLLVDPHLGRAVGRRCTVVALDDDRSLGAEGLHPAAHDEQPEATAGIEAEVLVEVVARQAGDRRLEDPVGGERAVRLGPASVHRPSAPSQLAWSARSAARRTSRSASVRSSLPSTVAGTMPGSTVATAPGRSEPRLASSPIGSATDTWNR
jgi:hypothetical protein